MTSKPDALLPSAKEVMQKIELAEAEEAEKQARVLAEAQAEKKALIDALSKPSGISEEEAIRRAMAIIERGIKNRKTESEVFRFPNQLCTDKGRAINQQELGWEETLTGEPKEMYEFWQKHLRPRGYKLKVQIVDFPEGLPGDIGMAMAACSIKRHPVSNKPRLISSVVRCEIASAGWRMSGPSGSIMRICCHPGAGTSAGMGCSGPGTSNRPAR